MLQDEEVSHICRVNSKSFSCESGLENKCLLGEYAILPQPFNYMAEGFYVELGKKRSDQNN